MWSTSDDYSFYSRLFRINHTFTYTFSKYTPLKNHFRYQHVLVTLLRIELLRSDTKFDTLTKSNTIHVTPEAVMGGYGNF